MSDVIEPIWVGLQVIVAAHDRQLAEHGGPPGVRDMGALESALGRPVNQWHYGNTDMARFAAAYAFGLVRNHPFVDGNKRSAWIAARLFLSLNGEHLTFDRGDAIRTVLAAAAGELTEDELADWFRQHLAAAAD
ncbi:type II toxin-antitoxin system death-on-curing family toxin [Qipengyuania sp.]|uniref:type II toxin-antitoxin system death-on-curing family toxin n=1 Tax=Qipengyuania sp. TaxID=2004515 RepID=UPI003735F3B4